MTILGYRRRAVLSVAVAVAVAVAASLTLTRAAPAARMEGAHAGPCSDWPSYGGNKAAVCYDAANRDAAERQFTPSPVAPDQAVGVVADALNLPPLSLQQIRVEWAIGAPGAPQARPIRIKLILPRRAQGGVDRCWGSFCGG